MIKTGFSSLIKSKLKKICFESLLDAGYILTVADVNGETISKEWSSFTGGPVTIGQEFVPWFDQPILIIFLQAMSWLPLVN